jgi:hypothetical protein
MKPGTAAVLLTLLVVFPSSCDQPEIKPAATVPDTDERMRKDDMPVLPVKPGDAWIYQTSLVIPADVTSPGASEVSTSHQRVRTYLGKMSAAEGLPETDCFEVVVPGSPSEREFVEIHDDRILMRGSLILRPETTKPMWLATPIPFVIAGMKSGTVLPEFKTTDGALSRRTEVIAREDVTVPAGTFPCVRMLTTGRDGDIELRRTVWFSPGKGIIREEKTRYRGEKLLYRETQELIKHTKVP